MEERFRGTFSDDRDAFTSRVLGFTGDWILHYTEQDSLPAPNPSVSRTLRPVALSRRSGSAPEVRSHLRLCRPPRLTREPGKKLIRSRIFGNSERRSRKTSPSTDFFAEASQKGPVHVLRFSHRLSRAIRTDRIRYRVPPPRRPPTNEGGKTRYFRRATTVDKTRRRCNFHRSLSGGIEG